MAFALSIIRRKTDILDDDDPSGAETAVLTPPEVEVWKPTLATTGIYFVLDFRVGVAPWPTLSVRVRPYARDATDGTWHRAGNFLATPNQVLMIQQDLYGHDVWLRLTAIAASTVPTAADPIRVKIASVLPPELAT
jgi:hypothetical protein